MRAADSTLGLVAVVLGLLPVRYEFRCTAKTTGLPRGRSNDGAEHKSQTTNAPQTAGQRV
ncbi:hypothetical protein BSU04_44040 [Caballeronia sordidicola]|uniref:Uncharacterized protein n=1 Tax=Caballeronia sordidicola TaxID=196367 RepID=A0A226WMP0_CABSO|nr:hypothetical protein BSU04_44040 [Caballeronia sordidicola]